VYTIDDLSEVEEETCCCCCKGSAVVSLSQAPLCLFHFQKEMGLDEKGVLSYLRQAGIEIPDFKNA